MQTSNLLAIISISIAGFSAIMAVTSIIYTWLTNRDKFIISASERKNILDWYEKANFIINLLKEKSKTNTLSNKEEMLAELSSLIDIGRFYFPNIENDLGNDKPSAYKGSRIAVLDFLVFIYNIGKKDDIASFSNHIDVLQRAYTSAIFETLNPRDFIQKLKRNSYIKVNKDIKFEDFIQSSDPHQYKFY